MTFFYIIILGEVLLLAAMCYALNKTDKKNDI